MKVILYEIIPVALAVCIGFFLGHGVHFAFFEYGLFAIVFALHFIAQKIFRTENSKKVARMMIWTTGVLYLVVATGATTSMYFYSLYFLVFALVLLSSTYAAATAVVGYAICTILLGTTLSNPQTLPPLIGLLAITPFAVYLGIEKKEVTILQKQIDDSHPNEASQQQEHQRSDDQIRILIKLITDGPLKRLSDLIHNKIIDDTSGIVLKEVEEISSLLEGFEQSKEA